MPKWIVVVLIVLAVLVAGLLRERWRMGAMATWARRRGFALRSPFVPGPSPPMAALAARLEGREVRRWGAGVEGDLNGIRLMVAEHETAPTGVNASGNLKTVGIWRVMAAWPVSGGRQPDAAALAAWPHGGELARDGDWAAWRLRGNLTPDLVEGMLSHLDEARRLCE
jgi:hypothetical protein